MKPKITLLLLAYLIASTVFAGPVEIELIPKRPLMGEPFKLVFKVRVASETEPYISFNKGSAEVLGRKREGMSINTTVNNGRIRTTRQIGYIYNVVANKSGTLRIKDINIEVDGRKVKMKDLAIRIQRERQAPKNLMILAIPEKTSVYIGEGFTVNYYLYRNVRVGNSPVITKFPKLKKFLKRFYNVPQKQQEETFEYNGSIYKRSLQYSARLYPEKAGISYIDPLGLEVTYENSSRRRGHYYGAPRVRKTTIHSKRVEIEVIPLPSANVPSSFTGLVGEHNFELKVQRSKFLANEPIEVKLTVSGGGALENYNAPQIYSDNSLESFDIKSEIEEIKKSFAKKHFDYTYLARGPINISRRVLKLSYFDTEGLKYVSKEIRIPDLIVGGVATAGSSSTSSNATDANNAGKNNSTHDVQGRAPIPLTGVVAPVFESKLQSINLFNIINYFFLALSGILIISLFVKREKKIPLSPKVHTLFQKIKKSDADYSQIHKLILMLSPEDVGNSEASLERIVFKSDMTADAKEYFKKVIVASEKNSYNNGPINGDFEYNGKYFREIANEIKNVSKEC